MDQYVCEKCFKKFKRAYNHRRHVEKCKAIPRFCPLCGEPNCKKITCRRESLLEVAIPPILRAIPQGEEMFIENWPAIQTGVRAHGARVSVTNLRLPTGELSDAVDTMRQIHIAQRFRYKVGLSVGLILQHRENRDKLRYFHASQNNATLLHPLPTITNSDTLEDFLSLMKNTITSEEVQKLYDSDTKWQVLFPTNLNVCVYMGPKEFPIGGRVTQSGRLKKRGGVLDFPDSDKLCVFRCISFHLYKTGKHASKLLRQFDFTAKPESFPGVIMSDLPTLENLFDIQIAVYTTRKVRGQNLKNRVVLIRPPSKTFAARGKVNLHLSAKHGLHVSLVTDFNEYAGIYECPECKTAFTTKYLLKRHRNQLSDCRQVALKYIGGIYQNSKTVFEALANFSIFPPDGHSRMYPYKITFDFEAFFRPAKQPSTERVSVLWEHVPLSASVASDFPGREGPICFVRQSDANSDPLLDRVLNYINETAKVIGEAMLELYRPTLAKLDETLDEALRLEEKVFSSPDGDFTETGKRHPLVDLKKKLLRYLRQVPVIGFNSGRYDLNLIKVQLHSFFSSKERKKEEFSVIKRSNQYLAIYTQHTVFLDVVNYLAPGYNYANYLLAFTRNQHKGHFPYEWMTSTRKLENRTLPPRSAFDSKLTGTKMSESDYAKCEKVWSEEKMQTFRDYLIYYNNKDVKPFIEALNNHAKFFRDRNIDMFKDGISLPGLTLRFLFQSATKTPFVTFHQFDSHLHSLIKKNLVGGPSIIFHRFHEKGTTLIREHKYGEKAKRCEHILGVDANSLYLRCMSEAHCTGYYVVRRPETEFRPTIRQRHSKSALEWLRYVERARGIKLCHAFNGGEVTLGCRKIRVDGFHPPSNTVYQFHGCWFHAHDCIPARRYPSASSRHERRERTARVSAYLKAIGYKLIVVWECDWRKMKRQDPQVMTSEQHWRVNGLKMLRNPMTERDIISSVKDGKMFGLIQVDITTPSHLREYFEEMTPIFKNVTISKSDIGPHMSDFANNEKLLSTPQKSLIGSYHGKGILLGTPLLKWYLDHGLIVTKVEMFIEYFPERPFAGFADEVTAARRRGDVNANERILSDCYKLMGNTTYGKTICNKEKHTTVKYTSGRKFELLTNSWQFKKGSELTPDLFEVELQPKTVKNDLPIQIGFMVYQYAKLKMLEFTFDFLDKFIDRRDYALCQMDTDSLYMALSGETLDELVKPDLRESYFREKRNWIPTSVCDDHLDAFVKIKTKGVQEWVPLACCQSRYVHDQRTPGLFKSEWEGHGILSLNSKTYICYDKDSIGERKSKKWSAKGVMKKQNAQEPQDFLDVLLNRKPVHAVNTNFKVIENKMHTYTIEKKGLSYLYVKRRVHSNGVTTSPLEL